MWKLDKGDGMEIVKITVPEQIFSNATDTPLPIEFSPDEYYIHETSYFESEDNDLFNKLVGEHSVVYIPKDISLLSEEYKMITETTLVSLYAGEEFEIVTTLVPSFKWELNPKTSLIYNGAAHYRKIKATYCVTFIAEEDNQIKQEIEGKWYGVIIDHREHKTRFESIETE